MSSAQAIFPGSISGSVATIASTNGSLRILLSMSGVGAEIFSPGNWKPGVQIRDGRRGSRPEAAVKRAKIGLKFC
jgi:hypothetical protein